MASLDMDLAIFHVNADGGLGDEVEEETLVLRASDWLAPAILIAAGKALRSGDAQLAGQLTQLGWRWRRESSARAEARSVGLAVLPA